MTYSEVDWGAIHRQKSFTVDKCWTTCNGGFCCSNNYPDFVALRFIPTKGTTIIYMEEEYNYLFQNDKIPPVQARTLSLDFGAEKPLRLIYLTCRFKGLCKGIIEPPLLCKLYPLIPIFSFNGKIEDLYQASVFELTFKAMGEKSPCTIKKECSHYFELFDSKPLLQLLNHPYFILYSKAAKAFADTYVARLKANTKLMNLKGKDFWQTWEHQYLTGQILDADALKQIKINIKEAYKILKNKCPGFSL